MTNRVGLAVTLLGVLLLVTSSVGVSTVVLERGVEIEVVDDDAAMVGFETHEQSVSTENGSEEAPVDLITVTNRAERSLNLTVDESDAGISTNANDSIDAGENETITADVTCDTVGDEPSTIDLTLSGDGITIERTIDVTPCNG
ncbi:hypothetical protein GS429_01845 [Natronorubrum sp. JWXQ-INN-674]|uniref:Uncharacterized protein n=1 Tax=Natronorubrum halalkaliphilum TaxID=2691917 RepID=A0A6B0VJ62_9EURY|nr:hypothetical protein [Natronorubrum halalkaliphilum]MXV60832.1 hypothetical protein [Natronorubrum halalkaliphilum]